MRDKQVSTAPLPRSPPRKTGDVPTAHGDADGAVTGMRRMGIPFNDKSCSVIRVAESQREDATKNHQLTCLDLG